MPPFMIAVHAGAGYHSPENEEGYKRCKFKFDLMLDHYASCSVTKELDTLIPRIIFYLQ